MAIKKFFRQKNQTQATMKTTIANFLSEGSVQEENVVIFKKVAEIDERKNEMV